MECSSTNISVPTPSLQKFKTFDKGSVSWLGQWENKEKEVVTQAIFQTVVPNIHIEGPVFVAGKPSVRWAVPVDDTSYRSFVVDIQKEGVPPYIGEIRLLNPEKGGPGQKEAYTTWSLEDKQRWQTDYLVQKSLGPVALHSEERLTNADTGVVMLRRILKQQAKLVGEGKDPVGVVNAGDFVGGDPVELDPVEVDRMIDVNVRALYFATVEARPARSYAQARQACPRASSRHP